MEMGFRQYMEALGQWTYSLPKDREQQIYDFYILDSMGEGDDPLADPGIKHAIKEARSKMLEPLKKQIEEATFFAICAEARHVLSQNSPEDVVNMIPRASQKFVKKYIKNLKVHQGVPADFMRDRPEYEQQFAKDRSSYLKSYKAARRSGATKREFTKIFAKLFEEASWPGSFGGEKWANIAKGWLKLDAAKSERELMTWIDHVFSLQHNTNTVFNKVKAYAKAGGYDWIKKALNTKRYAVTPWEFFEKASGEMRRLAGFAMRSKPWEKGGASSVEAAKRRPAEKRWKTEDEEKKDPHGSIASALATSAAFGHEHLDDEMWKLRNDKYTFPTIGKTITKNEFIGMVEGAGGDQSKLAAIMSLQFSLGFDALAAFIKGFTKEASFHIKADEKQFNKIVSSMAKTIAMKNIEKLTLPSNYSKMKKALETNPILLIPYLPKGKEMSLNFMDAILDEVKEMKRHFLDTDQKNITHEKTLAGIDIIIPKSFKPFGDEIEKAAKFNIPEDDLKEYEKWNNKITVIKDLRDKWKTGLYVTKVVTDYLTQFVFGGGIKPSLRIPKSGPNHYIKDYKPVGHYSKLDMPAPISQHLHIDVPSGPSSGGFVPTQLDIPLKEVDNKKFKDAWATAIAGDNALLDGIFLGLMHKHAPTHSKPLVTAKWISNYFTSDAMMNLSFKKKTKTKPDFIPPPLGPTGITHGKYPGGFSFNIPPNIGKHLGAENDAFKIDISNYAIAEIQKLLGEQKKMAATKYIMQHYEAQGATILVAKKIAEYINKALSGSNITHRKYPGGFSFNIPPNIGHVDDNDAFKIEIPNDQMTVIKDFLSKEKKIAAVKHMVQKYKAQGATILIAKKIAEYIWDNWGKFASIPDPLGPAKQKTNIPRSGLYHKIEYGVGIANKVPVNIRFNVPLLPIRPALQSGMMDWAKVTIPWGAVALHEPLQGANLIPWIMKSEEFKSADKSADLNAIAKWLARYLKDLAAGDVYPKGQ